MSHYVFEVLQAKIEKNSTFFFFNCFCLSIYMHKYFFFFFFFFFFLHTSCVNFFVFFFFFFTDLSGTGQKRKKLYEHIGNLDRLSKKGRKVIGETFWVLLRTVHSALR